MRVARSLVAIFRKNSVKIVTKPISNLQYREILELNKRF
jgi:hypothetical protein